MKKRGFTLVELLVVISIIALLLAVLLPALGKAKMQAASIVCLANTRSLSMAWFMYSGDNNSKIVASHTEASSPTSLIVTKNKWKVDLSVVYSDTKLNNLTCWVEMPQAENGASKELAPKTEEEIIGIKRGLLYPYLKKIEVYRCPMDKRIAVGQKGRGAYRSYSIAGCMDGYWSTVGLRVVKRFSQIPIPSRKYVFVEEFWNNPGSAYTWNSQAWQLNPLSDKWTDPLSTAHGNKSILGFADGHGEAVKWKDKRTIEFSENKSGRNDPQSDNPDLQYMQERWTRVN
jgi:prepilin-type N-terminal cleavage/methylation domain-containing protein/prepilin-type processing-associated H-X9-DG protein